MAIKEVKREWSPEQLDYVKEYLLHSEKDVKDLPHCCIGSKARVSETGNVYVCSASGEWAIKGAEGGVEGCTSAANKVYVTDPSGNPVWEDRTHGGKRVTVEWDGTFDNSTDTSGSNINNSTFLNGMQRYWKISDLIPSKEELFSGDAFCATTDGESNVYPEKVWENDGWYGRWELIEKPLETLSVPIIVVITKPGQYMGYNFTETGIHTFAGSYGKKQKFASLTYGWFKQLDKMYLPDGYPYEAGESTLVRDWGTLTFEVTAYGLCAIVDPMDFEEGVSYAFLFDGVEYVCKPVIRDDGKFIGNGSIWGIVSDDTGEPFCFAYEMGQIHTNSAGDHTMSVSKGSTEVHPLDPKFLPPDITIPSGGSLTLAAGATVNDEAGVLGGGVKTFVVKRTPNEEDPSLDVYEPNMTFDELMALLNAEEGFAAFLCVVGQGVQIFPQIYKLNDATIQLRGMSGYYRYSSDGTFGLELT